MRVAVVTSYATPTNMRNELLRMAAAEGDDVVLVAPTPAETMRPAVTAIGARYREWSVDRTGMNPSADLRSFASLLRILRDERPDVVLAYQIKAVLLAPMAARLAGVGRSVVLVNGLGSAFDTAGYGRTWKARLARAAYRISLATCDAVVFQNEDDPQLLLELGVMAPSCDWNVVRGSGVDVVSLQPSPPHVSPPTFTLISRLLRSKGIPEFVEAARITRQRHPEARFIIAGQFEAPDHPDAVSREQMRAWVGTGVVEYVGFESNVELLLRRTSVFVLPSYYREGVPRTNLEALALGRPVVTTDSVGCRDTVADGENGFLVPARDADTLAARLEQYLKDPALLAQHGTASRRLAETRFDIRDINATMLAILRAAGRR